MKRSKNQKGITLVALIITIIVLLILAVVAIREVQGEGIITYAKKTRTDYQIAEEKEIIQLSYSEYKIAKSTREENITLTVEGAKVSGSNPEKWVVNFEKTKNNYVLYPDGNVEKLRKWEDYGLSEANIGDYVNYDELSNGEKEHTVDYAKNGGDDSSRTQSFKTQDFNWRILGINEYGELELISDNPSSNELKGKVYLYGENGWLNAEDILNTMCNELYGKGNYAASARSLKPEDINKLANYDPTTYNNYGREYIYRASAESTSIQFSVDDGTTWKELMSSENKTFRLAGEKEGIGPDNYGERKIISTYYNYDIKTYIANTEIVDMISKGTGTEDIQQCLAGTMTKGYSPSYGICRIINGKIDTYDMYLPEFMDDGLGELGTRYRYRPVVTLKSNIQLVKNGEKSWNIQ